MAAITADGPPPLAIFSYNANGSRTAKNLEPSLPGGGETDARMRTRKGANSGKNLLQNGTEAVYTYDMASRLTQIAHASGSTALNTISYTLNSVGNRTSKSQTGSAVPGGMRTETYTFDAVDQLTGANYGTVSAGYDYDAVGNRTSVTGSVPGAGSYSANNLNQYSAAPGGTPTYDNRGNLSTQNGWTYAYDSKNRLLNATDGTASAGMVYDYRNRQVSRTINGTTMYFVWDGWSLIEERDDDGDLIQKYVNGPTIDEIIVKIDGSGSVYYHQDGLGSAVLLSDAIGNVSESYQYDAFGSAQVFDSSLNLQSSSLADNRFLFTGRELVVEVELYDYRNRYYSAELGRFLQTDPIRFSGGDVNFYRYAHNNVFGFKDPYGLECGPWHRDTEKPEVILGLWGEVWTLIGVSKAPGLDFDVKFVEAEFIFTLKTYTVDTYHEYSIPMRMVCWCDDDPSIQWVQTKNVREPKFTSTRYEDVWEAGEFGGGFGVPVQVNQPDNYEGEFP